ncbi:MAG: TonB-dependent receptor [Bacteroidales bacterium]
MKKMTILLAFLLFVGFQAAAQMQITGTVTEAETGEPIPGVSVVVKDNTTIGTTTDLDGNYSLTVPENAVALFYSFVGMQTVEEQIAGRSIIDVVLEADVLEMDEVVVTGYRTRKREVVSSSVSVVSNETLETMVPSTSIDNMLQGKAAGVDATALNGKPGQTATIKVRGAISLNTTGGDKAQPLYVVDGVYLDEEEVSGINPKDIESMTILKDASAASIYGSRGANGVIVITTKSGKAGQTKFEFSSRYGIANKTDDPFEMMNAEQKIEYEESLGVTYTPEEKQLLLGYDHDWQDDILKQATIESYNLSASGGNENTTFYTSVGYDKNSGIVQKLDGFERISARLNLNSQLTDKLKIGATVSGSHSTSDEPRDRNNVQNPIRAMYDYNPYTPVYQHDSDGSLVLDDNGDPIYSLTMAGLPILEALENNPESEAFSRFLGNVFADYEIIEGLKFMSKASGSYIRYKREYYMQPGSVLDGYVGDPGAPGNKTDEGTDSYDWTWLNQFTYKKSFGLHNIDITAFNEFTEGGFEDYRLTSKGFASPLLTTQDNGSVATEATTSREEYSIWSLAGAIGYDFDGKYLANASIRRDGASRFGEDVKYGNFWSFSLGWNITEEDFMTLDYMDRLKLIVSYGTLGSWNIPNYASQGYYVFGSYGGQTAAIINGSVGNPELTWESQRSLNAGLEFTLFNNRLNGSIDYYQNTRDDFLFENPLSWESGAYSQYINAGEMVTNGLEVTLNGDIIRTSDFRWNLGANVTFIDYEINQLSGQEQIVINGISVLKEGEEPFTFYLPRYAGVDPDNGDALYYDADGNTTNVFSSGDAVVLSGKSPLPSMFGGFSTYLNYKGVDLSADFSFKYGNYIYNYMAYNMLSDGDAYYFNQRVDAMDYWKEPGDTDVLPRPFNNSNQVTDRFLQDGSYLRFRNLTLGYTLPKNWISKINIDRVRIYAQAQNLLTITNFEGDPEVSIGSGENQLGDEQSFVPGLYALYSYPALRSFTFGLDISF